MLRVLSGVLIGPPIVSSYVLKSKNPKSAFDPLPLSIKAWSRGGGLRRVPCVRAVRATHPRLAGLAGLPRTSLLAVGTNIWCPQS